LIDTAANRVPRPPVNSPETVVGDAAQVDADRDTDGVPNDVQRTVEVREHLAQRGHRDHGVDGAECGGSAAAAAARERHPQVEHADLDDHQ
jgi:hypothetical protein